MLYVLLKQMLAKNTIAIIVSRVVLKIWWNIYDQSGNCDVLAAAKLSVLPDQVGCTLGQCGPAGLMVHVNACHGETVTPRHYHNGSHSKSNVTKLSLGFAQNYKLGRLVAINFDCNIFSNVCDTWNGKNPSRLVWSGPGLVTVDPVQASDDEGRAPRAETDEILKKM